MKKNVKYIIIICLFITLFLVFKINSTKETKNNKSNTTKEAEVDENKYFINDISKTANSVMDNATKLKRTKSYLYFDESLSEESIQLNLNEICEFSSIDSITCLWNDELITNDPIIKIISWDNGVLQFNITEYIDRFNQIKVCSGSESQIIEVGEHYFQKLNKNTLEEKNQIHLDTYETEDRINSFHGTFSFDKTINDSNLDIEIPEKLKQLDILESDVTFTGRQLDYSCSVSKEAFEKLNLYSIEFDMIANQVERNKMYKVIECFIPLVVRD